MRLKAVIGAWLIVFIGFIGYFAYNQIINWHKKELVTAISQERKEFGEKTWELEKGISKLEEELALYKEKLIPEEKLTEVFGKEATLIPPEPENIECEDLEQQILAFFTYLDRKDYIILQKSEHGTYNLFKQMVKQLSETLPIVTAETRDIVSLTRNIAHFYRVLGNKRIELINEIFKNENDIFESIMATFFSFYTSDKCCKEELQGCPSMGLLYEYAGFFMNTMAGRSYLLRRDSRIRILTTYYCVLILDKANEQILNYNGIDIRPHIDFSINDISNQKNLIYDKQYLTKLQSLKEKYKM
jgi:hypothetical protein